MIFMKKLIALIFVAFGAAAQADGLGALELFLKAAARIDRDPGRCVVFEDSLHGIEAGLAGGMKVVGVATTHEADKLTTAHKIIHRLTEITVPVLEDLVG